MIYVPGHRQLKRRPGTVYYTYITIGYTMYVCSSHGCSAHKRFHTNHKDQTRRVHVPAVLTACYVLCKKTGAATRCSHTAIHYLLTIIIMTCNNKCTYVHHKTYGMQQLVVTCYCCCCYYYYVLCTYLLLVLRTVGSLSIMVCTV
jgi:hypothetical protein